MRGRLAAVLVATTLLCGCATITREISSPPTITSELDVVATHYFEVLDRLGPPDALTLDGEGFVFLYESIRTKENQIGLTLGETGALQFLRASVGRAHATRDVLLINFNHQGKAVSASRYNVRERIGTSAIVQPVFGVAPSVDTTYLQSMPPALKWGGAFLTPLPQSLNRQQDLDSGVSGVELRGMPTGAGQRSSEMRREKRGDQLKP